MSELIVIAFDNPTEAQQVATTFTEMSKGGAIRLTDMRVVSKDANGKLVAHDEAGHPVAWSAVAGGVLGGLLFFLMPVVGIAIGAVAGGAIAKSLDLDIDKKFIKDVSEALKPNTSAVFIQAQDGNQSAILNALKPYKGTLIQTNLSSDMEEQLKKELKPDD
jgi:uncharacterized membrane protein